MTNRFAIITCHQKLLIGIALSIALTAGQSNRLAAQAPVPEKFPSAADIPALSQKLKKKQSLYLYLQRARAYYSVGDYARALPDLNEVLAIYPNQRTVIELRANALAELGKCSEAIDDFLEKVYAERGRSVLGDRNGFIFAFAYLPNVAKDWDNRTRQAAKDPKTWFGIAYWKFLAGDYATSYSAAAKAIALKRDFAEAYIVRAYAGIILHKFKEALADVDKVVALHPDQPRSYSVLVDYYYQTGAQEKALTAISDRLRKDPGNAWLFNARGDVYNAMDQPQKAVADYTAAIKLQPKWSQPYESRGSIYRIEEELDKSNKDLETAIQLDPRNAKCYAERATLNYEAKKFERAAKDLTQVIALKFNIQKSYLARAGCYEKLGRRDLAARDRKAVQELMAI